MGNAFLYILYKLAYVLFIIPYDIWKAALYRLADQKEKKSLMISEIKTKWPLFSFLKRWFFEFLFDFIIAVAPFFTFFFLTKGFFTSLFNGREPDFLNYILLLFLSYYGFSVGASLLRDLFALLLRPFAKLLSWFCKPAQHLDSTINRVLQIVKNEDTQIADLESASETAKEQERKFLFKL